VPAHRPAEPAVRPPEGSVLDRRTLNRTLLARQHLLDRVAMPVPAMIEHLVGLQAQMAGRSYRRQRLGRTRARTRAPLNGRQVWNQERLSRGVQY
jgi:hypothetical protein